MIKTKTRAERNITTKKETGLKGFFQTLFKQKTLMLMTLPFLIHCFIFAYIPLYGWLMAFQNYRPRQGFNLLKDADWVGLEHFKVLIVDDSFLQVLRNTLGMSIINLVMGMLASIGLALVINEMRQGIFKKFSQTVSYLPHFISWAATASMITVALSSTGVINELLMSIGILDKPIMFLTIPKLFWWLIGFLTAWKGAGWGSIIYLGAMTGIDPNLYEAADVEGAGRIQKIWHITLPSIKSMVVVVMIMQMGWILSAGFEPQWLLQNAFTKEYAEVFERYIVTYGMGMQRYSYATAVGIFRSVVSIIMLLIANQVAGKLGEDKLFATPKIGGVK